MYYGFSALVGLIIAVMLLVNGGLSGALGAYSATVVIHIVGLLLVVVLLLVRREKVRLFPRELPFYFFLGGVIGVSTTAFNNLAFGKISLSAILALGLLGQTLTSLVFDCFGLLGMEKRSFRPLLLLPVLIVLGGILFMLLPLAEGGLLAAFLSLITGVTIVLSRTLNGQLTERVGAMQSTLYNYITGLATAIVVLLCIGRGEPLLRTGLSVLPSNPLLYTGGMMGVATVVLSNITVHKIPAFLMTLFLFVGQVFTGIVIDAILDQGVLLQNVIGGLLVAAGMILYLFLTREKAAEAG